MSTEPMPELCSHIDVEQCTVECEAMANRFDKWMRTKIKEEMSVEEQLTFSTALVLIKDGKRVQRAGWNGKNMFVFLVPGSIFKVNRPPLLGIYPEGTEVSYHGHIDLRSADGRIVPWQPSQADMLADDWAELV